MRPQAPHPRQVVLELRELHLKLSLGAVCVIGEDVEDHRGAVDDRDTQRGLEVALLPRDELVVAGDQVRVGARDLGPKLRELAASQIAIGVGGPARLDQLARRRDPGGAEKLLELGEGIALARRAGNDSDRQRALSGAWVLDAGGGAVTRTGLRGAAVTGSLHRFKCRSASDGGNAARGSTRG